MKKTQTLIAGAIAAVLLTPAIAEQAADPNAIEAKGIVKEFFGSLKGELEAAMKAGGPANAIEVCKEKAPAIAQSLSEKTGWDVGRTSLKLRNTEINNPDDWEKQVLLKFDERKAGGEDVKTMAYAEVVETDEGKRYRFMKAIPTLEVCIVCHGPAIDAEIAASLDKNYPNDQARGYNMGDVRGAFTLSKPQ